MLANFSNQCFGTVSFAIEWNGGATGQTDGLMVGQSAALDLDMFNIPKGASCWARAYVLDGPTHDSSGNFMYAVDNPDVTYTLSGTVFSPEFSCVGCWS